MLKRGLNDITYLLSDHLGSTTTTVTNGLIAKESYYPFGATRTTTGTIPTDKLFTGQQQESGDALGLYQPVAARRAAGRRSPASSART